MTGFAETSNPMAYINLRYKSKPPQRYVENELMEATIMLLADRALAPPNVTQSLPRDFLKTIKTALRPSVLSAIPPVLTTDLQIKNKSYDQIFKAPKLKLDTKKIATVVLDVWPLFGSQECRYSISEEDMYIKEVSKFLIACQVMSKTNCYSEPAYREPVIKAHAKSFFIRGDFSESASVKGRLYIKVPKFVEEVAAIHCPAALCTMTPDEIQADSITKEEIETPWS